MFSIEAKFSYECKQAIEHRHVYFGVRPESVILADGAQRAGLRPHGSVPYPPLSSSGWQPKGRPQIYPIFDNSPSQVFDPFNFPRPKELLGRDFWSPLPWVLS